MITSSFHQFKQDHPDLFNASVALGIGAASFFGIQAALTAANTPAIQNVLNTLLATNSAQVMWYVTRSAGFASYILLWLSIVLGLAIPTRLLDHLVPRAATYDFHQFISLLALGFIGLHVGVLMVDQYLPFSLAQILVPFISPYRPLWVGIGVFALYLAVLVTVSTYMKSRIGLKAFKFIHTFSLLSYLAVTVHSLYSGTDSSLLAVQWMYGITFAIVVLFSGYWMLRRKSVKPKTANRESKVAAGASAMRANRSGSED